MFDPGTEPEDIFAGTESAPKPAMRPPAGGLGPQRPPLGGVAGIETGAAARASGPSWVLLSIVGVVVLGGIGFGVYWFFFGGASTEDAAMVEQVEDAGGTTTPAPAAPAEDATPEAMMPPTESGTPAEDETAMEEMPAEEDPAFAETAPTMDSDGDGLDDTRETLLGTDVMLTDTDGDGLSDREEVEIYGSDPRVVDTDGDTYADGVEVRGGYDPNGPGRLFQVPPQQ